MSGSNTARSQEESTVDEKKLSNQMTEEMPEDGVEVKEPEESMAEANHSEDTASATESSEKEPSASSFADGDKASANEAAPSEGTESATKSVQKEPSASANAEGGAIEAAPADDDMASASAPSEGTESATKLGQKEPSDAANAEGGAIEAASADDMASATKVDEKEPSVADVPPRPIKKARTAYFIFADEKRAKVQAEHPGEGVGAIAKAMGQLWSNLDPEERAIYQAKAAQERERVARDLANWKAVTGLDSLPPLEAAAANSVANSGSSSTALPMGRIRKICKLDPDVKGISKEALLLITKCAELATTKLGQESVKVAQLQNRRKLLPEDVAQVCATREQYLFLKDDVKDLLREQHSSNEAASGVAKTKSVVNAATESTKPLTAYFGSTKSK